MAGKGVKQTGLTMRTIEMIEFVQRDKVIVRINDKEWGNSNGR